MQRLPESGTRAGERRQSYLVRMDAPIAARLNTSDVRQLQHKIMKYDQCIEKAMKKTIRQELTANGRTAEEIEALAEAFAAMGQDIDEPELPQVEPDPILAAQILAHLNDVKGIDYF